MYIAFIIHPSSLTDLVIVKFVVSLDLSKKLEATMPYAYVTNAKVEIGGLIHNKMFPNIRRNT